MSTAPHRRFGPICVGAALFGSACGGLAGFVASDLPGEYARSIIVTGVVFGVTIGFALGVAWEANRLPRRRFAHVVHSVPPATWRCLLGVLLLVVAYVGIQAVQRQIAERRGAELESLIARIPLGVTAAEADAAVGEPPDRVYKDSGVLMSPVIMLSANNPKAAAYGAPQQFTMRSWKRGYVKATVAIDSSGKVAGHWTWR